ncbi:hypothetical protein NMY22_g8848 [Coprinellus aureogranulatus]|nr:hypothetical protein NMY22_g8848 [Coprinellus aureogranulatus]
MTHSTLGVDYWLIHLLVAHPVDVVWKQEQFAVQARHHNVGCVWFHWQRRAGFAGFQPAQPPTYQIGDGRCRRLLPSFHLHQQKLSSGLDPSIHLPISLSYNSNMSASQILSPPNSPRDHRLFVPRRPSPLSLPPMAPSLTQTASSTSSFQPFSLTEIVLVTPKTGSKMPRYPLEKQRRAFKDLEMEQQRKRQSQQMQRQDPMQVPGGGGSGSGGPVQDMIPSPTTTLPLTPRSGASSISSYSQHDSEENSKSKPRGNLVSNLCATYLGSCFGSYPLAILMYDRSADIDHCAAAFAISSKRIETINMRSIASAR